MKTIKTITKFIIFLLIFNVLIFGANFYLSMQGKELDSCIAELKLNLQTGNRGLSKNCQSLVDEIKSKKN